MDTTQLDLFAAAGRREPDAEPLDSSQDQDSTIPVLDAAAIVALLPSADLSDAPRLAAEAGQRKLRAAVPALEQLCLRFSGFGLHRLIPEQAAALDALAQIGGTEAAHALARMIARHVFQGPTRKVAIRVAGQLRSPLPVEAVLQFLQDPDPDVRADGCRCARHSPAVIELLRQLRTDQDDSVRCAAACALGRLGNLEARGALVRLLRDAPSAEIIDAIATIADEDCIILLGRILRTRPALAAAAREALELIDHPLADQLVASDMRSER